MDKQKLNKAFRDLRKAGYFARQNFQDCQTCACALIPEKNEDKYVFYHAQDAEQLKERGEVYLAWAGDAQEIIRILNIAGVATIWDGSNGKRILCK